MSEPAPDSLRPAKRARLDAALPTTLSDEHGLPARATCADAPSTPAAGWETKQKPPREMADVGPEARAGITEYVSREHGGFVGVFKQRYTDFLVNEIGLDGEVVRLKSTSTGLQRKSGGAKSRAAKAAGAGEKEGAVGAGRGGARGGEMEKEGVASVAKMVEEAGGEGMKGVEMTQALEQDKVSEQTNAEQTNAEQTNAEQTNTEQTNTEQTNTEQTNTEQTNTEQTNTEQKARDNEDVEVEKDDKLSEEDRAKLHSIFGQDTTKQIVALVRQLRKHEDKKAREFKAVIAPPISDKDQRTEAHKCLRRIFPNLLESSMEPDQSIRIKAIPPAERSIGGRPRQGNPQAGRQRDRQRWEDLGGDFLHFTLYKENKDTMEVIGFLGSKLQCGAKGFGFAGTKDRRACTAQRVSVRKLTAERMHGFNKVLFNATIGDYEYSSKELKLGDLKGNEFVITLRDCRFAEEKSSEASARLKTAQKVVGKAISDLSNRGFINYYGLQRFGSFAASTDAVGCKMLNNDFKGAVEDLLAYNDVALAAADGVSTDSTVLVSQDDRNRAKALHIWKTEGSGSKALDLLPRKFTAERNIIQHLSSRGRSGLPDRRTDWQGALQTIPRNLRLMYVHAYQSMIWNVVASERWTTHGAKVVPGDLVLVHEHVSKQHGHADAHSPGQQTVDQNGEAIIDPSGIEDANAATADFERARPLSADEAASGAYTIWDIVLPQPGFDVLYPDNQLGAFYTTLMASKRGGGLDPHHMRRPWREISLSGGYRKFLARPLQPMTFQARLYAHENEQFVQTDLERLGHGRAGGARDEARGGHGQGQGQGEPGQIKPEQIESDQAEQAEQKQKQEQAEQKQKQEQAEQKQAQEQAQAEPKIAVILTLQLASSQYATIALRELMKADGLRMYKPDYMGGR